MSTKFKVTALLFALLAAGYASSHSRTPLTRVPDTLTPDANESLAMILPARGAQVYECRPGENPDGGYEWVFVAPEADLFDPRGNRIGRHYAGPHWESTDGSRIVGVVKQRADAPAAGAIPWLLLSAKSEGPEGWFSRVTSVQRVNTVGGVAPPDAECSQASVGTLVRVAYTADYRFFAAR